MYRHYTEHELYSNEQNLTLCKTDSKQMTVNKVWQVLQKINPSAVGMSSADTADFPEQ